MICWLIERTLIHKFCDLLIKFCKIYFCLSDNEPSKICRFVTDLTLRPRTWFIFDVFGP